MTTTHPDIARPLTQGELDHVLLVIDEAPDVRSALADALMSTFEGLLHAFGGWDSMGEVNPTRIKIPEAQWHKIGEALVEKAGSINQPLLATNLLLEWMNLGPSTYKEA